VIYLLYVIHVLVCLFLILVVLLQQGKGADLSVFGGGNTQTAFGARSATTLLHKLTVASFVIFILTTVSIAIIKGGPSGTVMAGAKSKSSAPAKTAPANPAPAPAPAAPAPASGNSGGTPPSQ
jgi:preprotein translocase subunit SecG